MAELKPGPHKIEDYQIRTVPDELQGSQCLGSDAFRPRTYWFHFVFLWRQELLLMGNQAGSIPSLVCIRFEEHKNDHAGDRNVEPNGERPARDSAVHREPACQ